MGRYIKGNLAGLRDGAPGQLFEGQWIAFYDHNGRGYAQPDYYILYPDVILVVEVKLKQNSQAHLQLDQLYRPLLEALYKLPVRMLQIFKYPRFDPDERRVPEIKDVFWGETGKIKEWHWLGD